MSPDPVTPDTPLRLDHRTPAMTPLAYRIPDAAKVVGLTETQMWEMIREKRIAAIKLVGRRTLIERSELEAFFAREKKPVR